MRVFSIALAAYASVTVATGDHAGESGCGGTETFQTRYDLRMAQINDIIKSLEQQLQAVERAINALRTVSDIIGQGTVSTKRRGRPPKAARKKRQLSPEGRRRIIAALKKRWAMKRRAAGRRR